MPWFKFFFVLALLLCLMESSFVVAQAGPDDGGSRGVRFSLISVVSFSHHRRVVWYKRYIPSSSPYSHMILYSSARQLCNQWWRWRWQEAMKYYKAAIRIEAFLSQKSDVLVISLVVTISITCNFFCHLITKSECSSLFLKNGHKPASDSAISVFCCKGD